MPGEAGGGVTADAQTASGAADGGQGAAGAVAAPPVNTTRRTPDERKAMMAQQLQQAAARGLRIESQTDFQAVVVEGKPVNHVLHAIVTICTCGVWGVVWAVMAGTGGEKRHMVVVDEFGNVQWQNLGKA